MAVTSVNRQFFNILNIQLPYDPVVPLLDIKGTETLWPHKSLYMNVYRSSIYKS